ncbi:MAG TPA: tetratricopeptide repeat protein [Bacteroidetes bacterium]|nr:tetratricopeptide repeat protein [Bacteroidota bacterium]
MLGVLGLLLGLSSASAQFSRAYIGRMLPFDKAVRPVTLHPAADWGPALSPDGRWRVFVSNRTGNRDLWLMPAQGGRPYRLTGNRAEDFSPRWGGEKTVYFVSTRKDALGDIWKLVFDPAKVPEKRPRLRRVTYRLGFEGEPAPSPDKRWLVYTAQDSAGNYRLWLKSLRHRRPDVLLTPSGGFSASWSPDSRWLAFVHRTATGTALCLLPFDGKEAGNRPATVVTVDTGTPVHSFPFWAPSGRRLYFFAHDYDWNRNGKPDVRDRPWLAAVALDSAVLDSLWFAARTAADTLHISLAPFHLSAFDDFHFLGKQRGDRIFLSRAEDGDANVVSLPAAGLVPRRAPAAEQFAWADSAFSPRKVELMALDGDSAFLRYWRRVEARYHAQRLLAFQAVVDRFPEERQWRIRAGLQIARELLALGDTLAARSTLLSLKKDARGDSSLFAMTLAEWWRVNLGEGKELADSLAALASRFHLEPDFGQQVQLLRAELLLKQGRTDSALTLLRGISSSTSGRPKAQALRLLGRALLAAGQPDSARSVFVRLARSATDDLDRWIAARGILRLAAPDSLPAVERRRLLEPLLEHYYAFPFLAAELHIEIGKTWLQGGSSLAALKEFQFVLENYPRERVPLLQAAVLAIPLWREQNQEASGAAQLRRLARSPVFKPEERDFLRQESKKLHLAFAGKLEKRGEQEEAFRAYRSLVEEDSAQVAAHSGWVRLAKRLGRLEELRGWYLLHLRAAPGNPFLLYGLGLVESERAGPDMRRLQEANRYFERALAVAPRLIPAYLALGRNYERLENLQHAKLQHKGGQAVRFVKQLIAPVRWLGGRILGIRPVTPKTYLERGIAVLQLAREMNDERQNPRLEADICFALGNHYFRLGEQSYEQAYESYRCKIQLDTSFATPLQEATFFRRYGRSAIAVADWSAAIPALERAIPLYRNLRKQNDANNCRRLLALAHQLAGHYPEAVAVWKASIAHEKRRKNYRALLEIYRNLAYCHLQMDQPDEVRRYALQAMKILESGKISPKKFSGTAIRLQFLGYSIPVWNFSRLGSATLRRLYGFSPLDEEALLYTILLQNEIGLNEAPQAARLMLEKLRIFREQKDELAQAILMNNLGVLYLTLRSDSLAAHWLLHSLKLCRENGFLAGEALNLLDLSQWLLLRKVEGRPLRVSLKFLGRKPQEFLTALKTVLSRLDAYPLMYGVEKVELAHQRAVLSALLLEEQAAGDSLSFLPAFFAAADSAPGVLKQFDAAEERARALGLIRKRAFILKNAAEWLMLSGLFPEAKDYLRRAVRLVSDYGLQDIAWRFELAEAEWLYGQGRRKRLEEAYTRIREKILGRYRYQMLKPLRPDELLERDLLFRRLISLALGRGDPAAALRALEEWWHLQRLDGLRQVRFRFREGRRAELYREYLALCSTISGLQKRYQEVLQRRIGGYRKLGAIQDSLTEARSRLFALQDTLRQEDGQLLSVLVPESTTPSEARKALRSGEGILVLWQHSGRVVLWALRPDSLHAWVWPLPDSAAGDSLKTLLPPARISAQVGEFFEAVRAVFAVLDAQKEQAALKTVLTLAGAQKRPVQEVPSLTDFAALRRLSPSGEGQKDWLWLGADSLFAQLPPAVRKGWKRVPTSGLTEGKLRATAKTARILVLGRPLTVLPGDFFASAVSLMFPGGRSPAELATFNPFPTADDGIFHLFEFPEVSCRAELLCWPDLPAEELLSHRRQLLLVTALRLAGVQSLLVPSRALSLKNQARLLGGILADWRQGNVPAAMSEILQVEGQNFPAAIWFGAFPVFAKTARGRQ